MPKVSWPVELIVSYNGLKREDLLEKCRKIGRYIKPGGLFLLVFPRLFFGEDDTSHESKALRDLITNAVLGKNASHTPPDMHLEATGIACRESDSLPLLSMMCGVPELYDFEEKKPSDSWKGASEIEHELEYRLYKKRG